MSSVSASGFGNVGLDDVENLPSTAVAGATTLFILVVSGICMWMGADAQRVLLTASLSLSLFALLNYSPPAGIGVLLFYLGMVGGLKRYMIPVLGYSVYDPLLLVGPIIVGLFAANRLIQRNIPRDTTLSKLVLALIIIMLLEVVNPLQGGITIGIAGIMYYIVPLLWYYVGRQFGTKSTAKSLLITVISLAVLNACYGLYQQYFGFSEIEREWIAYTGNDKAMYLTNGVARVFAFFSSFAEYAQFLGFASVVCFCMVLQKRRVYVIPFVVLLGCVFLSSSRGTLLATIGACTLAWAVQGRSLASWTPRLIVAAIIGGLALVYSLNAAKSATNLSTTTEALITHQARGILSANDKQQSTGSLHISLLAGGLVSGLRNPLGHGLGSTTLAAGKFGVQGIGTEFDVTDMFVACGLPGGVIFACIVFYTLRTAVRRWRSDRDFVSLVTLVILPVAIGSWLQGGHYAGVLLIWFLIGSMDRITASEAATKVQAVLPQFRGNVRFGRPALSPTPVRASVTGAISGEGQAR